MTIKIDTGLFDSMVLQRNRRDVSDALITGASPGIARLTARLTGKGGKVKRCTVISVAKPRANRFQVRLTGIPVGGPYDITLTALDSTGSKIATPLSRWHRAPAWQSLTAPGNAFPVAVNDCHGSPDTSGCGSTSNPTLARHRVR
jgi:hypothetical protein